MAVNVAVDPVQDTTDLLLLGLVGVVAYLLWKTFQAGENFSLCNFLPASLATTFGCPPVNASLNTALSNAGGQSGGVGGYDTIDSSGKQFSCTGPAGSSSDMCVPVSCDSSANCTPTGPAVPASGVVGIGSL